VTDTTLVNKFNLFILEVVKAWTDPTKKKPKRFTITDMERSWWMATPSSSNQRCGSPDGHIHQDPQRAARATSLSLRQSEATTLQALAKADHAICELDLIQCPFRHALPDSPGLCRSSCLEQATFQISIVS